MNSYEPLVTAIVKEQEKIIGSLAWSEAEKVSGIKIQNSRVAVVGEGKRVLQGLVKQYEGLFGQASVEACKDAVRPLLPKLKGVDIDLPEVLL